LLGHKFSNTLARVLRAGLIVAAVQVVHHAFESHTEGGLAAVLIVVMDGDLLPFGAIKDQVHLFLAKLAHRCVQVDFEMLCCCLQRLPIIAAFFTWAAPL